MTSMIHMIVLLFLPGLGAGFPVLRKTNQEAKEEKKSEGSPALVLNTLSSHCMYICLVFSVLKLSVNAAVPLS